MNLVQKTKHKKALFFFPFVACFSIFISTSCKYVSTFQKEILINQIIDGDTFVSNNIKFRVLGIDTPETYDSNNNFQQTEGSQFYYGSIAKEKAKNLLLNKKVLIESIKQDIYKRWVAKVTLNNSYDYGTFMIENGWAVVRYISNNKNNPFYYYDKKYIDSLYLAQEYAKNNKKGFWAENEVVFKNIFPNLI